jgi:hypothetical protein
MKPFLLKYLLFLILVSAIPKYAFSQYEIKGKVLDIETDMPLEFATVFINNTTFGGITDREGDFRIPIPAGNHELIISFMGYQTFTYYFNTRTLAENYTFRVSPQPIDLEETQIQEKRDKEWYKNLEIFTEKFLGTSINAKKCKIINPEVLILDNETHENVLLARSKEALEIKNPNTGYTIKYVLEGFEYNFENNITRYAGYPFFIEESVNKRKQKSIEEQRARAFNGSINHFMRALYKDALGMEGFEIYGSEMVPNPEKPDEMTLQSARTMLSETRTPLVRDSLNRIISLEKLPDEIEMFSEEPMERQNIVEISRNDLLFLTYNLPIFILFLNEVEEPGFRESFQIQSGRSRLEYSKVEVSVAAVQQVSRLKMLGKAVQIFENGSYFHPFDIYIEGYMAWEKVGDLMPFDYGMEN